MTDKESFESLKTNYDAIKKEDIKQPNVPVDTAVNGGMELHSNASSIVQNLPLPLLM